MDWLVTTTSDISSATGITHFPGLLHLLLGVLILFCYSVLVAHNGFLFDFPILLAEVEHRPEWFSL
jgi:hypothetical protein